MVKSLPAMQETCGLIPWLGRYPGEENDNPFQYSCLGNPMDRGDQQAIVPWGRKRVRYRYSLSVVPDSLQHYGL